MPNPVHEEAAVLEKRRATIKHQIDQASDMRPGSLVERYRRCGKPGCHCAGKGASGHGPSWSLTRTVGGKTVTRIIPPHAVDATTHAPSPETAGTPQSAEGRVTFISQS